MIIANPSNCWELSGGIVIRLKPHHDPEIKTLYEQGWSSTQIAERYGVTHRTILLHLKQMGVKRRDLPHAQFAYHNKAYPEDLDSYSTLYELYIKQRLSKKDIGEMYRCAPHVIDRMLRKHNIPVRDGSEAQIGLRTGEKHHNWQGGISPLSARCRQFFQDNISPNVRRRDNYKCQQCGASSHLAVHHIVRFSAIIRQILSEHPELDPVRDVNELYEIITHDERFLDENNLITYCDNCHRQLHRRQSAAKPA